MPRASLHLEDQDGTIEMRVLYEGPSGFDKHSNAHQHMKIVLKVLDLIAERREIEGEKVVDLDHLDETIQQSLTEIRARNAAGFDEFVVLDKPPEDKTPGLIVVDANGQTH